MDSPVQPPDVRAELVRLLQRYVVEAVRLGRVFAEKHHLHPTDWAALLAVIQGFAKNRHKTIAEKFIHHPGMFVDDWNHGPEKGV